MPLRLAIFGLGLLFGLQAATQLFAWTYHWADALGPGLRLHPDLVLYPPWAIALWAREFGDEAKAALARSVPVMTLAAAAGLGLGSLAGDRAPRRIRGWGGLAEARSGGLLEPAGAVLGLFRGRVLATTDLRPSLVTGGTRSGKGRGHVTPTLLSWGGSVLVHDPKRELWSLTAGWRAGFSHALYLDPRDPLSACWNPLAEIRPGPGELAQVQRLVAILSDPGGARDDEAIWDKAASEILEAVILHVLFTAEDHEKSLLKVRDLIADMDQTAEVMMKTWHRLGPDGEPQTHPFIRTATTGYATMHERFRTSVQGTARSYLKWLAGEDVERVLSSSDFAMGDLMCAQAPVSLYVQVAPADAAALRPLVRLLFYAAAQALTAEATLDAAGRPKQHKLLMVMDEFPLLGRLAFFEKSLRLMSGYGVKPMLVAQSLNDIVETYGVHNTILDNCGVFTAFSALDPLTQDKVSKLTGSISERRISRSSPAGLAAGRASISRSETDRPLLEPGEIRALPDDQQLVFVAGHRPLRTHKLHYDQREPFRSRANLQAPDQACGVDCPGRLAHPWAGRRSLGEDAAASVRSSLEAGDTARDGLDEDLWSAASTDDLYDQLAREVTARSVAYNHNQGFGHDQN